MTTRPATYDELYALIDRNIPTATIEETSDGELIIYTGLRLNYDDAGTLGEWTLP